ncbi:MAG: SsrA-binding protein SmpB [Clostridia bacterium]|nr:SsrA-binding protein SmpB [Clostridia bacterium]
MQSISTNKVARHEYYILETFEAGIVLSGTEIKSIRQGKVNIKDSFATIRSDEVFIHNMHISPYEKGNIFNKDPLRTRKLLLHKNEIMKIKMDLKTKGLTLIPLSIYFKDSIAKVELGIAKGKKLYDKRQDIAKKEFDRRINKLLKQNER